MSEETLLGLILGTTLAILMISAVLVYIAVWMTDEAGGDDRE